MGECPAGVSLCIVACAKTTSKASQWSFKADGTIRPKDNPTTCLQVSSKSLDAQVSLHPCANSPPSLSSVWKKSPGNKLGAGTCVRTNRNGDGTCLFLHYSGQWTLSDPQGHLL